jgi:hypothetical protein
MPMSVSILIRRNSFPAPPAVTLERRLVAVDALLLRLLRRLPDEEVGGNRRPEDGDQSREEIARPLNSRQQKPFDGLAPRHMDDGQRGDVGEQRQREPFEHADIPFVVEEDLRSHRDQTEEDHVKKARTVDQESERIRHCTEIGSDVHRIGHKQHGKHRPQQAGRQMSTHIAGDPVAGDPSDPGRYLLNGGHQWVGEKHRPANAEPQLGARLAVGADSGGIVVGRSGDQPRTERVEETPQTETGALPVRGRQHRLCHLQTPFDPAPKQKGLERFSKPVAPCRKISTISAAVICCCAGAIL